MKITIFIFLALTFTTQVFSQKKYNTAGLSMLDSVKVIYGDSCEIGVNSSLIKNLYRYRSIHEVGKYLEQYENIRNKILNFRKNYHNTIEREPALLLDVDRIFHNYKQDNIINACGIYFGPDSVTNLVVSYTIVRNDIENFYIKVIQLANFDNIFKKEITEYGDNWFTSAKLKGIKNVPFKLPHNIK